MILVNHRHLLSTRPLMCNKGARKFFRAHNIDWSAFVKEGVPDTQLIATGDALALRVVETAQKEWAEKVKR